MQTIKLPLLLGAAMIYIIMTACTSNATDNKSTAAAVPAPALPVDVVVAGETPLQQSETVAGSVVPNRTVDIMSELPKKVSAVFFKDGSYVSRGQVLYKLDDADISARLRQLQADLNLARISENRLSQLLKTETVRQEEYDIALAKLHSLQAGREILQAELSKTFIRAPFSGIIGITKAYAGTLVSPGMPMVNLQEQGILKIEFTVSEKYLPLVKAGNKIKFSTAFGDEKLSATVVSSEASVDMQSRNITVQAVTGNAGGKLKAGMSAKVFFNTSAGGEKGIMIPTDALVPGANGFSVFLVKSGIAKFTPVAISNRNEEKALVNSGVSNGDSVIVSNLLRAADGIPVSVVSIQ